jgi:hypothetical protein
MRPTVWPVRFQSQIFTFGGNQFLPQALVLLETGHYLSETPVQAFAEFIDTEAEPPVLNADIIAHQVFDDDIQCCRADFSIEVSSPQDDQHRSGMERSKAA